MSPAVTPEARAIALLPCPFCGRQPHSLLSKMSHGQDGEPHQDHIIRCPQRHATVQSHSASFASEEWNRRTPDAAPDRQPQAVRAAAELPMSSAPRDGTRILIRAVTFAWNSDICQNVATGDQWVEGRWFRTPEPDEGEWVRWCGNEKTRSTEGLTALGWAPVPSIAHPDTLPAPEADLRPCQWAGGNDYMACRTCGAEYDYRKKDRPACSNLPTQQSRQDEPGADCPTCSGSGWDPEFEGCPACGGSGEVQPPAASDRASGVTEEVVTLAIAAYRRNVSWRDALPSVLAMEREDMRAALEAAQKHLAQLISGAPASREVERLRAALEPFADFIANTDAVWADDRRIATLNYDFDKLKLGLFRAARDALASPGADDAGGRDAK